MCKFKKRVSLLVAIFFMLGMISNAGVVLAADPTFAEAFPDANFRSRVLSQLSYRAGSSTLTAEDKAILASITSLDVSGWNIQSLTGLEYFSGLVTLYCDYNQLKSLNVSKNTALEYLYCGNNQLSSLDLSKNTALISFGCYDNQLSSLDVSKNTALQYLLCGDNQLSALDISKNTALEHLDCSNNRLTALDVTKNTALKYFDCFSNRLTILDVSKNTALGYLNCAYNQLSSLDVSKSTTLKYFYCNNNRLTVLDVSKNTTLDYLDCYNNQLTALDVSKNIAMRYLYCGYNRLTALDVSKNTALEYLDCNNNLLTALDVSKNTALKHLFYFNNYLGTPVFTITAAAGAGGTISNSGSNIVASGGSITFSITANSGYRVSSVVVDNVNAGAVLSYTFSNVTTNHAITANFVANSSNGGGGFGGGGNATPNTPTTLTKPAIITDLKGTEPQGGTPTPSGIEKPWFNDVPRTSWFYDDVKFVVDKGLFYGTSDFNFSPNLAATRGMLVTVLYRLAGEPGVTGSSSFTDVSNESYYAKAVAWASSNGIVNGVGDNRFEPDRNITRQELAVIILRYTEFADLYLKAIRDGAIFADDRFIEGWAAKAVDELYKSGIINGKNENNFDPMGDATRAQVAAILHRLIENAGK